MEINCINSIKKMNSGNRSSIKNILGEFKRENETYKNNVNKNLCEFNVILEDNNLDNILGDVKVAKSSKDVILYTTAVELTEFERTGTLGEFLLKENEWVDFYKTKLEEYKNYMGKDFKVICAVIHFDEMRPHLQVMGAYRSENDNEVNIEKLKRTMKTQFCRLNKKGTEWETINASENKKLYNEKQQEWIEKNLDYYIKKEEIKIENKSKKNNENNKMKYDSTKNKFSTMGAYQEFQQMMFENNKNNKHIINLLDRIEEVSYTKPNFVYKKTERLLDKAKGVDDIKEQIIIERAYLEEKNENKEINEKEQQKLKHMRNMEKIINTKKNMTTEDYKRYRKDFYYTPIENETKNEDIIIINDMEKNKKYIIDNLKTIKEKLKETEEVKEKIKKELKIIEEDTNEYNEKMLYKLYENRNRLITEMRNYVDNVKTTYEENTIELNNETNKDIKEIIKNINEEMENWNKETTTTKVITNILTNKNFVENMKNKANGIMRKVKNILTNIIDIETIYENNKKLIANIKNFDGNINESINKLRNIGVDIEFQKKQMKIEKIQLYEIPDYYEPIYYKEAIKFLEKIHIYDHFNEKKKTNENEIKEMETQITKLKEDKKNIENQNNQERQQIEENLRKHKERRKKEIEEEIARNSEKWRIEETNKIINENKIVKEDNTTLKDIKETLEEQIETILNIKNEVNNETVEKNNINYDDMIEDTIENIDKKIKILNENKKEINENIDKQIKTLNENKKELEKIEKERENTKITYKKTAGRRL